MSTAPRWRPRHRRAPSRAARACFAASLGLNLLALSPPARAQTAVGSKAFPESWILADALVEIARGAHALVEHKKNLGGTDIAFQALRKGSVDAYPEYSGTIAEVILRSGQPLSVTAMRARLAADGVAMSDPLGFNDGYALAVSRAAATKWGLSRISQLREHRDIEAAMSHEFLGRSDGLPGLTRHYGLTLEHVRGIQHDLAYQGLASGSVELTDIYTTDPQIARLSLVLLEDDLAFFPRYDAVFLYRADLAERAPKVVSAIRQLEGRLDEAAMIEANGKVVLQGLSTEVAARGLLESAGIGTPRAPASGPDSVVALTIARNVRRHLALVGASLVPAVALGIPLGIAAARSRALAILVLGASGVMQTIPSLALLAFLIPLLGIGVLPALAALFVYGLLPIVQNTLTGLRSVPRALDEAADAIGLTPLAKLRRVSLPMASRSIVAGIRTSAVIGIGTATLAALIGAEGLGNPIMQGIALRDTSLILQGAIPAAMLAVLAQGGFALLERWVVPRGLGRHREQRARSG